METEQPDDDMPAVDVQASLVTGSNRRTLEAIFRHPTAHNLEWTAVVALITKLGRLHEEANGKLVLELGGARHVMHKPHTKDLTSDEVRQLRQFIMNAGLSPERPPEPAARPGLAPTDLLIAVDHHSTRILHVDVTSDDTSDHVIRPYDPHHFLHHLTYKDQSRERGQRAPEEAAYYQAIADAVAQRGRIVVVGHGEGKSNAADHLLEYLKTHHREAYRRIVRERVADLSAVTVPQLLNLARDLLRS